MTPRQDKKPKQIHPPRFWSLQAIPWSRLLLGLFAIAAIWRWFYVDRLLESPLSKSMFDDARIYWAWSDRIAHGHLVGVYPFFLAPLYPYVLGLLRAVGVNAPATVLAVQSLWGAAAVALLADAARRLTTPAIGLAVGVLIAFYEMAVFFDGLFLSESLLFFVAASFLWWAVRFEWPTAEAWKAAILGLLAGFLAAGRATAGLLVVPSLFLVRARRLNLAAVLVGFGAAVLPIALHNDAASREWIPFTYNSGFNLYVGNNPKATGGYVPIVRDRGQPQGLDGGVELDGRDELKATERREFTPRQSSDHWTAKAASFARHHPGTVFRLALRKLAMLWNAREYPQIENVEEYRRFAGPIGLPLIGTFTVLGALAIAGAAFAAAASERGRFLVGYVVLLTLGTLPFFVTDRYRHELIPGCALLAAFSLARLEAMWRYKTISWSAAALPLLGLLIVHLPISGPTSQQREALLARNSAARLLQAGWSAAQEGRVEEAERNFTEAVRAEPRLYDAWGALIRVQVQEGRLGEARKTLVRARDSGMPDLPFHVYQGLLAAMSHDLGAAGDALRQVAAESLVFHPDLANVVTFTRHQMSQAR